MKSKKVLLIVDDEKELVESISNFFEDNFDDIVTAYDGGRALEILTKNTEVSCVICDINMPNMDGIETIKLARARNIEIPFIIYSGHFDDKRVKELAKYGVFDFVNKPDLTKNFESVIQGLELGQKIKNGENFQESFDNEYRTLLES